MKIIITMAGSGSRFLDAGFCKPKYMLSARQRTLFSWSLESLKNFADCEFIFVTLAAHDSHAFIEHEARSLGISSFVVKTIENSTDGQATSVLAVADCLNASDAIAIYNIDTYVVPDYLRADLIKGDGWIPCFDCQGEHFSFVEFDADFCISKIAEKERISRFATVGLYYFSSFKLFTESYAACSFSGLKEKYVAPVYSVLLERGLEVYASLVPAPAVHVLGTPDEVLKFDPLFISQLKRETQGDSQKPSLRSSDFN